MKTTSKLHLLILVVLLAAFLSACAQSTPGSVTQPANPTSPAQPTSTTEVIVPTEAPTAVPPTAAPTQAPTVAPTAAPTQAPTAASTAAPTQAASSQVTFVVKSADNHIQFVNTILSLGSPYNPAYTGLNPLGGSAGGTAYVYDDTNGPMVLSFDANGPVQLDFVKIPTYGLAVLSGPQTKLAWGTQLIVPNTPSSLQISAPDGSQLETLFQQGVTVPPVQDVAQRWSADGKSLYFSREPVGLGGYIVFPGASSLYKIDVASKQETELIPVDTASGKAACLDALSLDDRYVADHCALNVITIRDLSSGTSTTIQPPEGFTSYKLMGSARFSPDASRVAYALAKNDPNSEQGWVAISDSLQGSSKLILTGDAGISYSVVGWLNEQTLLVQSTPIPGAEGAASQLWTVSIDGSILTKFTDGSFLTAMNIH